MEKFYLTFKDTAVHPANKMPLKDYYLLVLKTGRTEAVGRANQKYGGLLANIYNQAEWDKLNKKNRFKRGRLETL